MRNHARAESKVGFIDIVGGNSKVTRLQGRKVVESIKSTRIDRNGTNRKKKKRSVSLIGERVFENVTPELGSGRTYGMIDLQVPDSLLLLLESCFEMEEVDFALDIEATLVSVFVLVHPAAPGRDPPPDP